MSSIIEGYSYDIFISYRQNDNKYDGWVTDFVDNLNKELEATIKDKISVYFDVNPYDGLLETHVVDASLKDKLKCLVFIPIISQTYFDSKSFAWQHEFVEFNKLAKKDKFGRDIRLSSGNVASRILSIKINDLDPEDKELLENEMGGVLRCVEFIYKSAGVNRPLRANEDHPQDNLNKTYYRDQINKVANAVKEIIVAIKKHNQQDANVSKEDVKAKPKPKKNLKTKIIIASVIVLALIVLGYFFIPKLIKSSKPVEKSIAVLPFKLLSKETDEQYLADGMMDAITLHLSKIKDLRVMSRTSVEQYRGTTKTTRAIGKELDVAYLLEGSFQKFGDNARLIVQLIKASEESHAWANEYNSKWSNVFSLQSEVAQKIASELNAVISPEEKQLIEKTPTANLTAYDFYQRGKEEEGKYSLNKSSDKQALGRAEKMYSTALKYDSRYAKAYAGLARVYWDKHYWEEYFSKNFLDSVLYLCDIALSIDPQLSEAHTLKGTYFGEIGKLEQSLEEFDNALKLNPNDWMALRGKALYYWDADLLNLLNYLQKSISINRGPELPALLREIGGRFLAAGFPAKSKQYYQEALKLDGDSVEYYGALASDEFWLENFNKSIGLGLKGYAIDSTNNLILEYLGAAYQWIGHNKESLIYYEKWLNRMKPLGQVAVYGMRRIGLAYWQNGYMKEAEYYFNEQINNSNRINELGRPWGRNLITYCDLAGVYAFRGEKEKAYKFLRLFNQVQMMSFWMQMIIKTDPLFNSIRNEPEFQQIAKDIEAKYQAEHERVRKWLEENNML